MLKMQSIKKSFSGVEVLHGVDLDLAAGEIHALIGHNGAGKSTLMRVLGGVYPDYEGDVLVDGEPVRLTTPKEALQHGIAVIYQDFSLVPDLDVAHNIALGREVRPAGGALLDHRAVRARSAAEAKRFGIALPMAQPVRNLGVAAQQQTEIVRALAREARILVMDEPTARLAPQEREQLFDVMRSLARQGVGIIYISHFLDEVTGIADRITVMRDGHVAARPDAKQATPDSLARLLVGDDERSLALLRREPAGRAEGAPALQVRDLAVTGRAAVSFHVDEGEIVAIAGLVGSGRTRLLRAIIGDVRADGEVQVGARTLARRRPRLAAQARLLMVPEDRKRTGLVLTGDVRQNIELTSLRLTLSRFGFVRRTARSRLVDRAIDRFAIRPPRSRMGVDHLSGGNAQKVLLARSVAASPKALLLDQPTAGVDIGAKSELHQQILDLAESGTGVVVVSDDLDEMLILADRILVVVDGRITRVLHRGTDRAALLAAISTVGEGAA